MKRLLVIAVIFSSVNSYSNINYIKFDKVPLKATQVEFLKSNEQYFAYWVPEWNYPVKKEGLIQQLKECLKLLAPSDKSNAEVILLAGDVAHYLYNLNEEKYFKPAEDYYKLAIKLAPADYRGYWFIAFHYGLSAVVDKGIAEFQHAEQLMPKDEKAPDFWEEYAYCMKLGSMTTHCLYAMNKVKEITGNPGYFEQQLGEVVRNQMNPVYKDSAYGMRDLWDVGKADLVSFTCRPFGIKIMVDSGWQTKFSGYENQTSFAMFGPQKAKNSKGQAIGYSIAVLIRVPDSGETLQDYVERILGKYKDKHEFSMTAKYDKMVAYELRDMSMYPDWGGGHMHAIAIERQRPDWPGLLLEEPSSIPKDGSKGLSYYRAPVQRDRFTGKLFYLILLDTCEDIYKESFSVFKKLFDKQLIIE